MSFWKAPRSWLFAAAFAAAFWITIRVMAASEPVQVPSPSSMTDRAMDRTTDVADESRAEIRDPALELMISGFANAARRR